MNYKHLNLEDRYLIEHYYFHLKYSIHRIAEIINRNPSTISREIKRNTDINGYSHTNADDKSFKRHKHKYYMRFIRQDIIEFTHLFVGLYSKEYHGIKPTIRFLKDHYKDCKIFSAQTIYNWIKSNEWVLTKNDMLRKFYTKDGKRKLGVERIVRPKYFFPFWMRPDSINNRETIGHWEADLIIGKKNGHHSVLLTLVERKTRYGVVFKLDYKSPTLVRKALNKWLKESDLPIFSITTDNGFEFDQLGLVCYKNKIVAYRADKYASWQKGTNEHFNGLIRRRYKKGTNFDDISDAQIQQTVNAINHMPREMFDFNCSYNVLVNECEQYLQTH